MSSCDQFKIQVHPQEKWEEILPLALYQFVRDEPPMQGIGATPEDFIESLTEGIEKWLQNSLCIVARDSNTDEIIGVKIAQVVRRGQDAKLWGILKETNETTKKYLSLIRAMESSVDIFDEDPTLQTVLDHILLCVHPDYRGRGVSKAMVEKTEQLAIEQGCQMSVVDATNIASQIIYKRKGYTPVFHLDYETFEVDGRRVINMDVMGNTKQDILMTKRL